MKRILEENCGRIDMNTCIGALRDHVNYPHSICRHPMPEEKITSMTYDSWVMIPAKKEWWIARGPPCLNEYKKYTF
jgi:isopenicillin-N N-acyltransferase-like protein